MGTFGGEVTSAKLFVGKNKANIDEDSLLSESIFGPVKSWECKCGRLFNQTLDGGKTCERCGVKCASNDLRLKTFGYINLVFPVIKPTKKKIFKKIVGNEHKHLLDPKKADALAATSRYLAVSYSATQLKVFDTMNAQPNWYTIPIRITGLYSFILSLKYVAEVLDLDVAKKLFEENYILQTLKVLPPDVRPIVRDPKKKGELRYSEVNKHYISILNLNKAHESIKGIKPQKEADWMERLKFNYTNGIDDELVDSMIEEWDRMSSRYQYYVNTVYETIFENISGKTGYIRGAILGKTIEFSGRAVIAIDPSLPAYKIKVSKKMLYKLWYPYYLHWMSKCYEENYASIFDNHTSVKNYEDDKELFDRFLQDFVSGKLDNLDEMKSEISPTVRNFIEIRKLEHTFQEGEDE